MNISDKQQAILACLKDKHHGLSLPELLDMLGPTYSERSLRRWLQQLVDVNLITKTGQKRATRYFPTTQATPSNEIFLPLALPFSLNNQSIVSQIKRPMLSRPPIGYQKQWLDAYIPNQSSYLSENLRQQMLREGLRQQGATPAGTYAHKIYERLLVDLSYNSSRLEGNTYSLLDTQKLLLSNQPNQEKLDAETVMLINHKEAIRYLVDKAALIPLASSIALTFHYLLADGLVETKYAGKVRDHGVRIALSSYVPLENQQKLRQYLKNICDKASMIRDPFEKSFFLLVHIAYLQAFIDVNKRTSRLMANIPLVKNNLVPLSFNDVDKDDYLSAMIAIYELNRTEPLAELYHYSYIRTCLQYDVTIESLEVDEVRVRYRMQRRAMLTEIIKRQLHDDVLDTYIIAAIKAQITEVDRKLFHEDLLEDLRELSPERIVGLGITEMELQQWLTNRDKQKN